MIFPDLSIQIVEHPAKRYISDRDYDEHGNDIGPNPNFDAMCRDAEGFMVIAVMAVCALPLDGHPGKITQHQVRMISARYKGR